MQCINAGAPTPLPFGMAEVVGCTDARSASKKFLDLNKKYKGGGGFRKLRNVFCNEKKLIFCH